MSDVYKKLAKHLDNLPGGYPATESGVEIRILKRLFTDQEAEIAVSLTMIPEPCSAIAERLNMDEKELSKLLYDMSKKGLLVRSSKTGENFYMAAQFVIGIWEYHVNDLDEGLIKDFNEYVPYLAKQWEKQKTQQLRVIPVSQSISAGMNIMPYEEAENIIKSQSKIVVADCICRKEHKMTDKGCDKPMETCLVFGGGAYFYEENGLARSISKEEALEILNKGIKADLVLQPGNAKKPTNICMCCGCCCQVLKNIKKLDLPPAKVVCSSYYATVDEEECTGCEACVESCQMDAITIEDDTAQVNLDNCIGCGLCVTACDFEAISMAEKAEKDKWVPPPNVVHTYIDIAKERGLT